MLRGMAKLVFMLLPVAAFPQQVVDRIVAVVNKQVILQSQLEDAAHAEFLLQGKPMDELTAQQMDAVLDRMIDQALLQQQIVSGPSIEPTAVEISAQIQDFRSRIPGTPADGKWQALLDAYGLTEHDIEMHVASQLRVLKFVDLRFRALARIDRAAISEYYQKKLVPQLQQQGAPVPPLDQVSEKIRQVLTEESINDSLSSWLQALRSQAHIEKITPASRAADSGAEP
jgi:parvulin-like peptidyl-prolyl isomerase